MESNPVQSKQIKNIDVDFKCLLDCDCRSCKSLDEVLQLIIDKLCANNIDLTKLEYACLNEPDTVQELIQEIINRLDCSVTPLGVEPGPGTSLPPDTFTNLDLCSDDNWACSINTPYECLTIRNSLSNPTNTPGIRDVVQSILKRMMSQQKEIKRLCAENTALKSRLDLLEAKVNQIQENCCNTTLINRIVSVEATLSHVQQTCCQ